ncbi:MAG: VanZ family protein [Chlorobiaceae bacterium]|nr:VanZ family protein [Chlorobiaceae bacterium]
MGTEQVARNIVARGVVLLMTVVVGWLALVPADQPFGELLLSWNDKWQHVLTMLLLTLGYRLYWNVPARWVVAGIVFYSGGIELLQRFVPNRQAGFGDLLADMAGMVVALVLCFFVDSRRWVRGRR